MQATLNVLSDLCMYMHATVIIKDETVSLGKRGALELERGRKAGLI